MPNCFLQGETTWALSDPAVDTGNVETVLSTDFLLWHIMTLEFVELLEEYRTGCSLSSQSCVGWEVHTGVCIFGLPQSPQWNSHLSMVTDSCAMSPLKKQVSPWQITFFLQSALQRVWPRPESGYSSVSAHRTRGPISLLLTLYPCVCAAMKIFFPDSARCTFVSLRTLCTYFMQLMPEEQHSWVLEGYTYANKIWNYNT